jgi:hypothetical protein
MLSTLLILLQETLHTGIWGFVLVGVGCVVAVLVVNELAARTLQRKRRGTRTSKRRQL